MQDVLAAAARMLRFLPDKDLFSEMHRRMLCRRLLMHQADEASERGLIEQLKVRNIAYGMLSSARRRRSAVLRGHGSSKSCLGMRQSLPLSRPRSSKPACIGRCRAK